MDDLISVIIPVFNIVQYLNECLASVAYQTHQHLEVLLIDDGSTDGSELVCDRWARRDSRFRVFHQVNAGVAASRNRGIELAQGSYIGFADPDDWLEPDMYERLFNAIHKYDADIAVCGHVQVKGDEKHIRTVLNLRIYDNEDGLYELIKDTDLRNFLWNKLFSRKVIEPTPFPPLERISDLAGTYKMFKRAKKTIHIPEALYNYRKRQGSLCEPYDFIAHLALCRAQQYRFDSVIGISERIDQLTCRKYIQALFRLIKMLLHSSPETVEEHSQEIMSDVLPFFSSHLGNLRVLPEMTPQDETTLSDFLAHPLSFRLHQENNVAQKTIKSFETQNTQLRSVISKIQDENTRLGLEIQEHLNLITAQKNEIAEQNSKIVKQKTEITELQKSLSLQIQNNKTLKRSFDRMQNSVSFRLGRTVTYLPRMIRNFLTRHHP